MSKRKSRAKWQRGGPIRTLGNLQDYVSAHERLMRRQDIMVYCSLWSLDKHTRVDRPTSITVLFNMPFALVESLCRNGLIYRAERISRCQP